MSFIKLKRKCEEDPKEILVLASKKNKLENDETDTSVFEFTGTAAEEKDIHDVIKKTIEGSGNIKTKTFDIEKIRSQIRKEQLERSKLNRLKVQNYLRNVNETDEKESVTVIDVSGEEDESTDNAKCNDYVYDIYYSQADIVKDPDFANNYSVHEVNNTWYNENELESEDGMEDDDDSNDENNWRNDYPDEEDYVDEDEYAEVDSNDGDYFEYLSNRMKNSRLSDNSLSSDEYDEAINDNLFNTIRHRHKSNGNDIDYYNEVISSEDEDTG